MDFRDATGSRVMSMRRHHGNSDSELCDSPALVEGGGVQPSLVELQANKAACKYEGGTPLFHSSSANASFAMAPR